MSPATRVFKFFSSFGLAVTVLSLLLLVTFLGTLEQMPPHGLFASQKKYFESMFVTNIDLTCCLRAMKFDCRDGLSLPVLIPGGYLLMILLSINMISGGIGRLKKEVAWVVKLPVRIFTGRFKEIAPVPRAIGVLIAHCSIVFMLLAGAVSLYFKKEGAVWVTEGQTVNEFESFHRSAIEIERVKPAPDGGKRTAMLIPGDDFIDLTEGKARTFTSGRLPFDLMIMNYMDNCAPRRAGEQGGPMVADGYRLQQLAPIDKDKKVIEQERRMDGAYARVIDKKSGEAQVGILWRGALAPWTFKIGDEEYAIRLGRRTYVLPFAVTLDKFERELHPGTAQARKFSSRVTVHRNGHDEKKLITMNQPLRYGGYAFFQSSFDDKAAAAGGTQSSMFQVVSNPSDNWPLISLICAGIGLLIHMIWKLSRHLTRTHKEELIAAAASKT